jgi:hypothetical protein
MVVLLESLELVHGRRELVEAVVLQVERGELGEQAHVVG